MDQAVATLLIVNAILLALFGGLVAKHLARRLPENKSARAWVPTLAGDHLLFASILVVMAGTRLEAAVQTKSAGSRPNILLIMSDDMGYSDLGCYGGEIRTPTLDRLASSGLRFSQFYNMARCCPTRASLLTGLHPHQAGVGHMTGAPKERPEPWQGYLSRRAVTIAEVLREAGTPHTCAGNGTWPTRGVAGNSRENWPLQRGFQRFYGTITGGGSFYDPTTLTRDNTMITPENDPGYRPERFYYTDAISDNAVRFVRDHAQERKQQPFFMYVAYTAAHWPMHAPQETIARYRGRYDAGYEPIRRARYERLKQLGLIDPAWELSPQAGDWAATEHKAWEARCMEVYAAMIDRMDDGIKPHRRRVGEAESLREHADSLPAGQRGLRRDPGAGGQARVAPDEPQAHGPE